MSDTRDAAITFEAQSMILRKDKTGWVMGFRVHPDDLPGPILEAPLGTRFQCVLFQIDDNENIVVPEEVRKGRNAVAMAGQLCREEPFQKWLLKAIPTDVDTEVLTASTLSRRIGIDSRSELATDEVAREAFKSLVIQYRKETRDGA